ncbi:MAG: alkaline phosphatase D family protein [Planctomycetota bacterium]
MIARNPGIHFTLSLVVAWFAIQSVEAGTVHGQDDVFQGNGFKVGAVTQDTAIIWTRLTARPDIDWDATKWPEIKKPMNPALPEGKQISDMLGAIPGAGGRVKLVYQAESSKEDAKSIVTAWQNVDPQSDHTYQFGLKDLKPGTKYQVQVHSRALSGKIGPVMKGSFWTAPAGDASADVEFAVVTGQDFPRRDQGRMGHKIYPQMEKLGLHFFVHTGDIEYYDKPGPFATNVPMARFKWNRLFGLANQRSFHQNTSSYFIKDDHDTLKNDCWPGQKYGDISWEDGLKIFKEQFPIGDQPYRSVRWGKHLQIWLVEGRDFRSKNSLPDGPEKTIWGKTQKEWFFKTVNESDATFRILISPTPIVGPDRNGKGDNHSNKAFTTEGNQLREFIGKQKNMFVCCGDRHWQYFSVDEKTGVREFSCGPTSNKHAGGWSNDKRSDMHQYLNVTGGFLSVSIESESDEAAPKAKFKHYSVDGKLLNEEVFEAAK